MKSVGKLNTLKEITFTQTRVATWLPDLLKISVSSGQVPHVLGHLSYAHGMMSHANSFSIPFSAHSGASWHVFWEEAPSRLSLFTESEAVSLQISGSASGTGSLVTVVMHILERMHYRMCKILYGKYHLRLYYILLPASDSSQVFPLKRDLQRQSNPSSSIFISHRPPFLQGRDAQKSSASIICEFGCVQNKDITKTCQFPFTKFKLNYLSQEVDLHKCILWLVYRMHYSTYHQGIHVCIFRSDPRALRSTLPEDPYPMYYHFSKEYYMVYRKKRKR